MKEYNIGERVRICGLERLGHHERKSFAKVHDKEGVIVDKIFSTAQDEMLYIVHLDAHKTPSTLFFTAEQLTEIESNVYTASIAVGADKVVLRLFENGEEIASTYGRVFENTAAGFAQAIGYAAKRLHFGFYNYNQDEED